MARVQMVGIAAATSLAGFLTTFTLLQLHMHAMWLRYGLAVLVAYGVFLLLIHLCIQHYQGRPDRLLVLRIEYPEGRESGGGWRSALHSLDLLDLIADGVDGILAGILIAVVCAGVICVVVSTAFLIPEWIAELVLEGAIGATAYRQLRSSTIRETAGPFVCLLLVFVVAGFVGQAWAPEAASIGAVIRHVSH
jgi:hypothetical protein